MIVIVLHQGKQQNNFLKYPCLLSKIKNEKRATPYTVEAISLDKLNEKNKKWFGINLVGSNKYIEYFLKNNMFNKIIKNINSIKREKRLGNSKIDFIINNNCYLEVKTFLEILRVKTPEYTKLKKINKINPGDIFIEHMIELSDSLTGNERAIILLVFQYKEDNIEINIDKKLINGFDKFKKAFNKFNNSGCELWQANLSINEKGISLID